jgi:hypothetical protein
MTTTAISAVVPRRPAMVAGQVVAVAAHVRPWVRLTVELCDGTGIVLGCSLRVEGTPWMEDGTLTMINPLYEFET